MIVRLAKYRFQMLTCLVLLLAYLIIYVAGIVLFLPSQLEVADAVGWYDTNWNYRKEITIDQTMVSGTNDLPDFIYLLDITDTDLITKAQADGDDILFTADDNVTQLPHDLEIFDSGTGRVLAWVSIPNLSASANTTIMMYYGNATTTASEDINFWIDKDFNHVFHMQDTAGNQLSNNVNSTPVHHALLAVGSNTTTVSGVIGNAQDFSGSEGYQTANNIQTPNSLISGTATDIHSYWIRFDATSTGEEHLYGLNGRLDWRVVNNGLNAITDFDLNGSGSFDLETTTVNWGTSDWHHVVMARTVTSNNSNWEVYVDGVLNNSGSSSVSSVSSSQLEIGYVNKNGPEFPFSGKVDELRMRFNTSWPANLADLVATEYTNQLNPTTYASLGTEETLDPDITVTSLGSESTGLPKARNQYLGGSFVFSVVHGTPDITSITIREDGTLDGTTDIENIKLYYDLDTTAPYDCTSESFDGTERKFGLTDTDGFSLADAGVATFTDSVTISGESPLCLYVVGDFVGGFTNTRDFSISIDDPSVDVVASTSVATTTSVTPTGSGSVNGSLALDQPWYDTDWLYRKQLLVDNTLVINNTTPNNEDDLYNYGLLVNIADNDLAVKAQLDADDIFFTNTYGTKLDHEIELYDTGAGTGELTAWVRLPHLYYNTDTPVMMYYGNAAVASQENIEGTWPTSDYIFVHHLEEGTTGNTSILDSTANNNDSVGVVIDGVGSNPDYPGKIGRAVQFDGSNDYIEMADAASQTPGMEFTIQAWVRSDVLSASQEYILSKTATIFPWESYTFGFEGSPSAFFLQDVNTGFGNFYSDNYSTFNASTWYFISAVRKANGDMVVYADGSDANTYVQTFTGTIFDADGPLYIGSYSPSSSPFDGAVDELRMLRVARSSDWIETEYYNHNTPTTFVIVGSEESQATNAAPTINSMSLNGGAAITLTANSTTAIDLTATVSDADGFADISSVNGVIYRSGLGNACSANDNNCYVIGSCSLSACAGNSCTATCSANIQYFAEPTDSGTYSAQAWEGYMEVVDSQSASDTATSTAVELDSLIALAVYGNIDYGTVDPGNNSGATNQVIQIRNTGNVVIDTEVSGSALCTDHPTCAGNVIAVGNQQYDAASFTFGAGNGLTTTPTLLSMAISKATVVSSPQESPIYWGISIPGAAFPAVYTGTNTITAVAN